MTEYDRYTYYNNIDDIPGYPKLFIKDGDFVFVTDKNTGEILEKLSMTQSTKYWVNEWNTNKLLKAFHYKGLQLPKSDPDTAKNIKELKKLCSDNTRHRKGDTGFLLDFIMKDDVTKTESKIFLYLTKNVVVWNYAVVCMYGVKEASELNTDKQLRAVWKSLQDKGLICIVNTDFECDGEYKILVKLHPRLYWEGRYSAWLVKCKSDYEYEDPITVS